MLIPSTLLEWIIKMIFESLEMDLLITRNQHGLIKRKSCQTKFIYFWIGLQEKGTKIILLGFSKDLDKDLYYDFSDKIEKQDRLVVCTVWMFNLLSGHIQNVCI